MKAFLAILGRELAERRLLFAGGAFAGLFPLLAPWLANGWGGQNPADLRGGTALGLAVIASSLLAVILGSTVIAGDLSERRLGFYFARPLPGWAIWAGKMSGAALLTFGVGALILLPALLAGGKIDVAGLFAFSGLESWTTLIGGLLLLLLASHVASVMIRSRSVWLAVDLMVLALVAAALWGCDQRLRQEGAFGAVWRGGLGFAITVLVALAAAGLFQVVGGRTDLRRGHRLLSLTLWTLVGGAALAHVAYAAWVLRAGPEDLTDIQGIVSAPAGSWIVIKGTAKGRIGYSPTFLLDMDSGRSLKLPGSGERYWWRFPLFFAEEGRRAVQLEQIGKDYQLLAIDLERPEPVLLRTRLVYSSEPLLALSPDGGRVAALANGRLTVDDLETGGLLVAVAVEGKYSDRLRFLGRDRVRLYQSSHVEEPGMPEIWRYTTLELDVASRRLVPVSRIEIPGEEGRGLPSPDGERAILRQPKAQRSLIADLKTGRTTPLPPSTDPYGFLEDGRMIQTSSEQGRRFLNIVGPDGSELIHVSLSGDRFRMGGLLRPDLLAVATAPRGSSKGKAAWTTWLIDLRTGRFRPLGQGIVPAAGVPWLGSPSARLFLRDNKELALLDLATGRWRTVLRLSSEKNLDK